MALKTKKSLEMKILSSSEAKSINPKEITNLLMRPEPKSEEDKENKINQWLEVVNRFKIFNKSKVRN